MKIYDFDEKFAEYARRWISLHPGLKPDQVEESYNEIMRAWLNAPATWLGGATPGSYFERYDDPKDLMKPVSYTHLAARGHGCAVHSRGDGARFPV